MVFEENLPILDASTSLFHADPETVFYRCWQKIITTAGDIASGATRTDTELTRR
jgi:hypothetical protein